MEENATKKKVIWISDHDGCRYEEEMTREDFMSLEASLNRYEGGRIISSEWAGKELYGKTDDEEYCSGKESATDECD